MINHTVHRYYIIYIHNVVTHLPYIYTTISQNMTIKMWRVLCNNTVPDLTVASFKKKPVSGVISKVNKCCITIK